MLGIVELVNEARGVFFVRCSDGWFAYFHAHPGVVPQKGDTVEFDESAQGPPQVTVPSRADMRVPVISAILHLSHYVAVMLVS